METKLYIGSYPVELGEDVPILYSYMQTDYSNPTVVKNGHSKTVTINGSPNNNKVFGHYWNVQRVNANTGGNAGIYFNASKKAPFQVFVNGEVYESGYVKLDKVNLLNNEITYDVTLYSGLGDFFYSLSYNPNNGEKLMLSDLNYWSGGTNEFDFTVTATTVYDAWESLRLGRDDMYQHINFMPAYNGVPDDFDADKVIINLSGTSLPQSDDSGLYRPTSGCVIADLPEEMTEWEIRDLRSYLQRPCVRMKSIINACCDPDQNGGYQVNLDSDFFDDKNPYYSKTWLSLPTLPNLEYATEEQILTGSTLIGVTTTGNTSDYMYQDLKFSIGEYSNTTPSSIDLDANIFINCIYHNIDEEIDPFFGPALAHFSAPYTSFAWFWNWNGDSYHTGWWCLGSLFVQLIALNGEAVVGASDAYNLTTPIRHNGKLYFGHNGRYPDEYKFKPYCDKNIYDVLGDFQDDGFHREGSSVPANLNFRIDNLNSPVSQLKLVFWWGATSDKIKKYGRCYCFDETEQSSWTNIINHHPGYWDANDPYFYTCGVKYSNFYAVLGSTLGRTGTKLGKAELLKTKDSPADYLLSYAKMFGLYFIKNTNENVISILTRKNFYKRDEVVNLNEIIDRSKDIKINPLTFSAKWYNLKQEMDESDWYKKYKTLRGIDYGCKVLNTGYEFNTETSDLLESSVIRSGIEGLEKSKFFSCFNNDNVQRSWMGMGLHYNLFFATESMEVNVPVRNNNDLFGINENEGMKYYDVFPKLQFHDDGGSKTDGNNVLVFFSGFKDVVSGRTNALSYYLSDDNMWQTVLNDGTPCWLFTPSEQISGVTVAKKVRYLPVFERYLTDENSGTVKKSLDFGTPQEIYIPDYSLTESANVYSNFWKTYIEDLFDADNRVLECYVKVNGKIGDDWMRRFYWFDNTIWRLNKVTDWKIGDKGTTQMEFVKVKDIGDYNSITQTKGTTILLTADKYRLDFDGGQVILHVDIDTGGSWRLSATDGVVLSRTTGTGNGNISATIPTNNEDYVLGWYFTVSSEDGATSRICVTQGYEGETDFQPVPEDIIIPASGGSYIIDFIWTNQGDDFINNIDLNEGEDYLQFSADVDTLRDQNKAILYFSANTGTTTLHNYCQFQSYNGINHSIGIDQLPPVYDFSESGGTEQFELYYSPSSTFSDVPEWIVIEATSAGTWSITAKNNPYSAENDQYITVTNEEGSSARFRVRQTAGTGGGGGIAGNVTPANLYFDATGGTQYINVSLYHPWSATSSTGSFWTLTSVYGDGAGIIGVTAPDNSGLTRTGTITITDLTDNTNYVVNVVQSSPSGVPSLTANPSAVTVPASGSAYTINLIYVDRNGNPVTLSGDTGLSGGVITWVGETGNTTVTVSSNPTTSARTLTMVYSGNGVSASTTFTQDAGAESITIPSSVNFGYEGGDESVTGSSNTSWTATTNDAWITFAPSSGAEGSINLSISAATNSSSSARTGYIYIHSIPTSALLKTIVVYQGGFEEYLYVAPSELRFEDTGGTAVFTVSSNTSWYITENVQRDVVTFSTSSVTMDNSGGSATVGLNCLGEWDVDYCPSWITLSANSGSGNTTLTITPDVNTGDTRSGYIIINGYSLSVTQRLAEVTITPSSITIPNSGGSQNINITCDGGWTLTAPAWAEASAYSGNGNSVVTISSSGVNTGSTIQGVISANNATCDIEKEGYYVIEWLTLVFTSGGTFKRSGSYSCEYKLNDGDWTNLSSSNTLTVSNGDVMQLRGTKTDDSYSAFSGTALCSVEGNPLSMCYGSGFTNQTTAPSSSYKGLNRLFSNYSGVVDASGMIVPVASVQEFFSNCSNLVYAPSAFPETVVNEGYRWMFLNCTALTEFTAVLPTTLTNYCYASMFRGCTSLTTAPSLPSTTLALGCYMGMFEDCTSLTTPPALPATELAEECYSSMFYDCTSLTSVPALNATFAYSHSYAYMFQNCSSITAITSLPITGMTGSWCCRNMFKNCTSLTTVPNSLPATNLTYGCYAEMFMGCTALLGGPDLPADVLPNYAYTRMFSGCTNFLVIRVLCTDHSASNCLNNWLSGVSAFGQFYKKQNASFSSGASGIPSGWTVIDE